MNRVAATMVGLALFGCSAPHRPPPIQEVPIGTEPPPPSDPNPADGEVALAGDVPSSEAGADDAGEADAAPDSAPEKQADDPHPSKKRGKGGKPVAIGPSAGGASGGGGGSGRAALEERVFSGHGSRQDMVNLMKICAKEKDNECISKLRSVASRPH
jgi:hypothetical protein